RRRRRPDRDRRVRGRGARAGDAVGGARVNRGVLFALGVVVIIALVSRLPADVFATTQAMLVLASGAILLALALSVFLSPTRRALGRLFSFQVAADAPLFAMAREAEWRELL